MCTLVFHLHQCVFLPPFPWTCNHRKFNVAHAFRFSKDFHKSVMCPYPVLAEPISGPNMAPISAPSAGSIGTNSCDCHAMVLNGLFYWCGVTLATRSSWRFYFDCWVILPEGGDYYCLIRLRKKNSMLMLLHQ